MVSSMFAVIAGLIMVIGGIWGMSFTHKNIAQEKITTPEDSEIPGVAVSGPMTLKAQADIIREHTLKSTGGKTFAEMPRTIDKVDADGKVVLGADGKAVQMPNTARDLWVTATTLTTALNLGILTYVFSGLFVLLGLISLWTGVVLNALSKKY